MNAFIKTFYRGVTPKLRLRLFGLDSGKSVNNNVNFSNVHMRMHGDKPIFVTLGSKYEEFPWDSRREGRRQTVDQVSTVP